jgi:hypothetical protein
MCLTGKLAYSTEHKARRALRAICDRNRGAKVHLAAYRCAACGEWHLGSSAKYRPADRRRQEAA